MRQLNALREMIVRVECKYMELVDVGRCTRKCLRFDQIKRNLPSGDLRIPIVVIQLGVTD